MNLLFVELEQCLDLIHWLEQNLKLPASRMDVRPAGSFTYNTVRFQTSTSLKDHAYEAEIWHSDIFEVIHLLLYYLHHQSECTLSKPPIQSPGFKHLPWTEVWLQLWPLLDLKGSVGKWVKVPGRSFTFDWILQNWFNGKNFSYHGYIKVFQIQSLIRLTSQVKFYLIIRHSLQNFCLI